MSQPNNKVKEFSDFVKGANEYILIFDADFKLIDCSDSLLKLNDLTRNQLIGSTLTEFLINIKERGKLAQFQNVLTTGEPFLKTYSIAKDEIERTFIELKAYKIGNDLAITEKDITALRTAEEEIEEFKKNLGLIAKYSPDFFVLIDLTGKLLFVDKMMEGYTMEQVIGTSVYSFQNEENSNIMRQCIETVIKTQKPNSYEILFQSPTKAEMTFEGRVAPIMENGKITSLAIITKDITERKKMREDLQYRNKQFWNLLYQTGTIVFNQDKKLRYTSIFNPHAGFNESEILGKTDKELLPENKEDYERLTELKSAVLKDGKPKRADVRMTINGGVYYYDLFVRPLFDADENITGINCASFDITERKKWEEALKESEKRLKEAKKIAHLGYYDIELTTGNIRWSEETFRIFERDPAVGAPSVAEYGDLIYEKDRSNVFSLFEKSIEEATSFDFTYRIIRTSGTIRYVHSLAQVEKNEKGKAIRMFGTIQDITAGKKREEALKENEIRLMEAEKIAHLGYYDIDLLSGIVKWSEETFRIFGVDFEKGEPTLEECWALVQEEDMEMVSNAFEKSIEEASSFDLPYGVIRSDGSLRYVRSLGEVEKNAAGVSVRIFGTMQDITVRRKAELGLMKQKELFQKLTDSSPSVILIFNIQKKQNTFTSPSSMSMLGYSPEELQQKLNDFLSQIKTVSPFSFQKDERFAEQLIHPGDRDLLAQNFEKISNAPEDKIFSIEYRVKHKKGHWVWLHDRVVSFSRNEQGQTTEFLAISSDVSIIKKLEADERNAMLDGQEQERQRIAADLHDAINPLLSATKLNVDSLKEKYSEMDKGAQANMDNIVDLLDQSMKEIKEVSANLMPGILKDFGLLQALNNLCTKISEGGNLKVSLDSHGLKRHDKKMETTLYRIAQELLNNTIKHAHASKIQIQLIQHKKSLILMLEDNGRGFNYPLDKSTNAGFGFRNVESRIKLLNGKMEVDSVLERGTTITIEIPIEA